ncbi:MAG: MFS transporter [Pirellulaceae bacterium]
MSGLNRESPAVLEAKGLDQPTPANERLLLLILAAVQFATIVDFMIVMPLGPQLMRVMRISPATFGLIVSSYTFAAGVAGLVASTVVDRFPRRRTFMFLYAGFLIGTMLCGLAPNHWTLVLARILTGIFGGVLGGFSMAIIGDVFPEERRGQATGSLMTGFALASVAGVPLGLVIGNTWGWHMTFLALAIAGIPTLILTPFSMPKLDGHMSKQPPLMFESLANVFREPSHWPAFALMISLTISGFLIFPYLSTFLVGNVGMKEAELPMLYIAGGILTMVASPIIGRLADRHGKLRVFRVIAPMSASMLFTITLLPISQIALAVVAFGCLMVCNVGRMIPAMSMVTSAVVPSKRGAFLSVNSSIQHIFGGLAAYVGGLIIVESSTGQILRFEILGVLAALSGLASIYLAGFLRTATSPAIPAETMALAAAAEANAEPGEMIAACVGTDG